MRELAAFLREHDRYAVIGHVSPDGDSYGSALAMVIALRAIGKTAFAAADPVPEMYEFLPHQEWICQKDNAPYEPETVLFVDTASRDRVNCEFPQAKATALLDHHETNAGFGDVHVIRGGASSTGELVTELLGEMGIAIDSDIAVCLYTAISTDTGNFQFSNTGAGTMRAVAKLLECGLDIATYSGKLFRLRTPARTKLLGEALHEMRLLQGGRVALTVVTRDMMERCGATHADTEGIVNYLNEIRGVKAAALLEEREGCVKCSLRSAEAVDVSAIAHSLGGGGHRFAAGCTVEGSADEVRTRIEILLGEAVG